MHFVPLLASAFNAPPSMAPKAPPPFSPGILLPITPPTMPPVIKFSKSVLPLPCEHTSYSVGILLLLFYNDLAPQHYVVAFAGAPKQNTMPTAVKLINLFIFLLQFKTFSNQCYFILTILSFGSCIAS